MEALASRSESQASAHTGNTTGHCVGQQLEGKGAGRTPGLSRCPCPSVPAEGPLSITQAVPTPGPTCSTAGEAGRCAHRCFRPVLSEALLRWSPGDAPRRQENDALEQLRTVTLCPWTVICGAPALHGSERPRAPTLQRLRNEPRPPDGRREGRALAGRPRR